MAAGGPLTPAHVGQGQAYTMSPAPQSFLGNVGHRDLQRQLEKQRVEGLGVGNSAGQAVGAGG